MNLEHFGYPCNLPEPTPVGSCGCSGIIYDYELEICGVCGSDRHASCRKECRVCGADGCPNCMSKTDDGEVVCTDSQCEIDLERGF